eukprot:gene36429-biopygen5143
MIDPRGLSDSDRQSLNAQNKSKFPSELIPDLLWNDQILEAWSENDTFPRKEEDPDSPSLILLAIDEARYTLETYVRGIMLFDHIRIAARNCAEGLPDHLRFIVAFLDTSSRIQNFSPSHDRDSAVMKSGEVDRGTDLFDPFILSRSFDVFYNPLKRPNKKDTEPLITCEEWLNAGRPVMKLEDPKKNNLVTKLEGGPSKPMRTVDKLAIMLARIGAECVPTHPYSTEMVAGNMASLLDTTKERDKCMTAFASEPALARAAGTIWAREGMLERTLLPALHDSIISGAFNKGRDGELVAQIVLMLAFDAVCESLGKGYGDVVPLRRFIAQLLPSDIADEEAVLNKCLPDHLWNASIACGQFSNLAHPLKLRTILTLAERHC